MQRTLPEREQMKFFKTNSIDDPGFDKTPDEVATEFWAADDYGKKWASGEWVGRLDRLTIEFMTVTYGGWDSDAGELDEVLDTVFRQRPR